MSSEIITTVASDVNHSGLSHTSSSNEGLNPKNSSASLQKGRNGYNTSKINPVHEGIQDVTTPAANIDHGAILSSDSRSHFIVMADLKADEDHYRKDLLFVCAAA
ncbi:hypothetical protein V865_000888 [Kwoniella europaea PYCC6329]|uniref:Uncharacterized protein n=1 Tax=Kwoniella europaea PYCC6329 TaxID=1423913 RepID=A0AAX4K8M5_9TREE